MLVNPSTRVPKYFLKLIKYDFMKEDVRKVFNITTLLWDWYHLS